MAYEFQADSALVSGIITLIIASLFVYFAARFVIDRSSFLASILTVLLGTFLASLVAGLVSGILGLVLGVAAWALVAAVFFRTAWVKGAIIGVVAWLLWFLVSLAINAVL